MLESTVRSSPRVRAAAATGRSCRPSAFQSTPLKVVSQCVRSMMRHAESKVARGSDSSAESSAAACLATHRSRRVPSASRSVSGGVPESCGKAVPDWAGAGLAVDSGEPGRMPETQPKDAPVLSNISQTGRERLESRGTRYRRLQTLKITKDNTREIPGDLPQRCMSRAFRLSGTFKI